MKSVVIKKEWIFIGISLIVASIAIFLVSHQSKNKEVVITWHRKEYGRYSLEENQIITIEKGEKSNTLEIKDGEICMTHATCPDKICTHMSPLSESKTGVIVCLPHELLVIVE